MLDRTQADAGTVWQGAKPVYRFSVRNTGSAPLTLALKSHCGCAVAKGDRTIPPGGSGIVEAVLDTTSFRDRIDKAVELMTNDPDRPRMMLLLRATVRSVVTVHPGEVLTVPLDPTGPTRRELALRLSDGSPVALKDLRSDSPFASVVTAPAGAPGSYRAVVTILAGAPLGRTAVTLSGVTGSERQRGFKITLHCEKGILVSPLQVHLGAVTPGERLPLRRSVTLSRASAPFAVRRVRCEDPSLETRVVRQRPGRFLLDVSYRGGWSAGKIERTLIVETDDRVQPQLSIPVTALVMPSTAPGR